MKRWMSTLITVGTMSMVLALSACHDKTKTTSSTTTTTTSTRMTAMNDKCMCGHALGDRPVYETYKGKTIAFCCADCKAKFDAMTMAQKDAYVAKYPS